MHPSRAGTRARPRSVLVIGGGVSGTACAGTLASLGHGVALLSAALDTLGMPEYSPCFALTAAAGGSGFLAHDAPEGLRQVWFGSMWVAPGGSWGVVDRRRVSVRLKEWVEESGVELRQGLVTSIGKTQGGWRVDTAFGESITAPVLVLAVGLSLGGRHLMRGREFSGARVGEVPSDRLLQALEGLGMSFETSEVTVGPRLWRLPETLPGALRSVRLEAVRETIPGSAKPASGTAAAEGVVAEKPEQGAGELEAWVATDPSLHSVTLKAGSMAGCPAALLPDGAATGEWYVTPGLEDLVSGIPRAREGYVARGRVLSRRVDEENGDWLLSREVLDGLWATGRVAGARHAAESLGSGIVCAKACASAIDGEGGTT